MLREFVIVLKDFLSSYKPTPAINNNFIKFVKQGTKPTKSKKKSFVGLLHFASDWKLLADIGDPLVIPTFLTISTLRPDVLLYSRTSKTVIIIGLTF